ncbi:Aste57867_893 [Aphanomyces stellatus]|uniref:Mediator of RNA polymerase II transcription subunit 10 n=1 Tax=Aphanomyces stellatus TaxID=120398 RepID=A0A485K3S5_9STRA|nr:hypothetical protein As57867_000892 [Aphanomyces stellatus]VFT78117.1 Aste57867_893 [Aphanomyces stellatus]
MSNSPSSPSSIGNTSADASSSSMSVPLPSPSMESAGPGSMVLSPYQGTQGYTSATPAFTPLASPLTHPSPGPSQLYGSANVGGGSSKHVSPEDELSVKLSSIMKALDTCLHVVRHFNGDQQQHMQKAVHTYVQRLAELNLYLQHMSINHTIPHSLMAWLDQLPMDNPEKWTYQQLQQCATEAAQVRGKIQALQLLRHELRTGLGLVDP